LPRRFTRISRETRLNCEGSVSAYRGKAVLLIFWLTACGICRHELPLLDRLSTEFRSRGFEGYSAPPLNEPLSMQTAKPLSATTSRVCPRLC